MSLLLSLYRSNAVYSTREPVSCPYVQSPRVTCLSTSEVGVAGNETSHYDGQAMVQRVKHDSHQTHSADIVDEIMTEL